MSAASLAQYGAFLLIVTLLVGPVGAYLARVLDGERTWLDPVMGPLERAIYRLAGVDPKAEMDWKCYAGCVAGRLVSPPASRSSGASHASARDCSGTSGWT